MTVAIHLQSIVDHDGAVILDVPRNTITTLDATGPTYGRGSRAACR